MKKIFTILITAIITSSAFGQYNTAPQKISYQAIIRNSSNSLVQNGPVDIKISILDGSITGPAIYVETHTKQTNQNGLIDLQIGNGTVVSGIFTNGIYWGQPYFLKTEIDPMGNKDYTITSTSELLSVPVSNYAHISSAIEGYNWQFIGAYQQTNQAETDFWLDGYTFMSYVGLNRICWKFKEPTVDSNQDGVYNLGEIGFENTLYGTVSGNIITFPPQVSNGESWPQIIGTLNGNNLTVRYGSSNGEVLELMRL